MNCVAGMEKDKISLDDFLQSGHTLLGGDLMETGFVTQREKTAKTACFRLSPEKRLCPRFDNVGIALYPVAERGKMGFRVVSDFCQEHIM